MSMHQVIYQNAWPRLPKKIGRSCFHGSSSPLMVPKTVHLQCLWDSLFVLHPVFGIASLGSHKFLEFCKPPTHPQTVEKWKKKMTSTRINQVLRGSCLLWLDCLHGEIFAFLFWLSLKVFVSSFYMSIRVLLIFVNDLPAISKMLSTRRLDPWLSLIRTAVFRYLLL